MRRSRNLIMWIFIVIIFLAFAIPGFMMAEQYEIIMNALREKAAYDNGTISLQKTIEKSMQGTKGNYGIAIKNLQTGESYGKNDHVIYESASLYKVWVMAIVYERLNAKELQPDQVLRKNVAQLNKNLDVPPDEADQASGIVSYTVKDALEKMITISDNNSALLLTDAIGLSSILPFLEKHGLTESRGGEKNKLPTTSAHDMALFFEKLYTNQLANESNTKEMIKLLKKQQLNYAIPKYLLNDVSVAHKTGALDTKSHDAGIVYAPFGNYVIAVLSNSDIPTAAEDRIGNLSRDVYDYFADRHEVEKNEQEVIRILVIAGLYFSTLIALILRLIISIIWRAQIQ